MDSFTRILVACPEEGVSQDLMGRVRWLATSSRAEVTLATVVDSRLGELERLLSDLVGAPGPTIARRVLDSYLANLERWAEPLRAAGIPVRTAVDQGNVSLQLVRRVLRDGHDLLIKDADDVEDGPFLRGPDMALLRTCPCPVWILNAPGKPGVRRILAAVDTMSGDAAHEQLNHQVMGLAVALARQERVRLDVVSVWFVPEESTLQGALIQMPKHEIETFVAAEESKSARRLEALVAVFAPVPDGMRTLHLKGRAAPTILRHVEAEGIDTLIMGTVARTGIAGFLIGNTAETILGRVQCSVLAVKPEGFVSPVEAEPAISRPAPALCGAATEARPDDLDTKTHGLTSRA